MANPVVIDITGKSEMSPALRASGQQIRKTFAGAFAGAKSSAAAAFRGIGTLAKTMGKGIKRTLKAAFSMPALIAGVAGGFVFNKLIKGAATLDLALKSLGAQTGLSGRALNEYVDQINAASEGLLDFKSSAQVALQGTAAGMDLSRILTVVGYISKQATISGMDPMGGLRGAIEQMGKGEVAELAKYGLNTIFESTVTRGQKVASVLRQMEEKTKALGLSADETAFKYRGISGALSDIMDQMGMMALKRGGLGGMLGDLSSTLQTISEMLRMKGGFTVVAKQIIPTIMNMVGAVATDIGRMIAVGLLYALEKMTARMPILANLFGSPEGIRAVAAEIKSAGSSVADAMLMTKVRMGQYKQQLASRQVGLDLPTALAARASEQQRQGYKMFTGAARNIWAGLKAPEYLKAMVPGAKSMAGWDAPVPPHTLLARTLEPGGKSSDRARLQREIAQSRGYDEGTPGFRALVNTMSNYGRSGENVLRAIERLHRRSEVQSRQAERQRQLTEEELRQVEAAARELNSSLSRSMALIGR